MGKDVIIACDFATAEKTYAFLDQFTGEKPFVKIGMELFYAEGPAIVRDIKARGHKIFLDLKLHDIPNTVKSAMKVLSSLDVDMTNLHAFGTIDMMKAAVEGLTRPDGTRPLLIAVTQLTSTSQERMEKELLIREPLADVVLQGELLGEHQWPTDGRIAEGKHREIVALIGSLYKGMHLAGHLLQQLLGGQGGRASQGRHHAIQAEQLVLWAPGLCESVGIEKQHGAALECCLLHLIGKIVK